MTGKVVYKGNPIKHPKGIPSPFFVDCNVKGFDSGATNVSCKTLWEHSLIPAIISLTAHDGARAGAQISDLPRRQCWPAHKSTLHQLDDGDVC